jgi:hypothetical protein
MRLFFDILQRIAKMGAAGKGRKMNWPQKGTKGTKSTKDGVFLCLLFFCGKG